MKRTLTFLAVVMAITATIPANQAQAAEDFSKLCNSEEVQNLKPSQTRAHVERVVKDLITCAVERFPVPVGRVPSYLSRCASAYPIKTGLDKAQWVACHESTWYPWTDYNGCYGVFQMKAATWTRWREAFPKLAAGVSSNVYNPRANVLIAIRAANAYGWGSWSGA